MRENKYRLLTLMTVVILVVLCGKLLLFDITKVHGHSMEPILLPGQTIVSFRASYGFLVPFINRYLVIWKKPSKGDILVLENPLEKKTIVKRCIGVEGDMLEVRSGELFVGNTMIPGALKDFHWSLNRRTVPKDHVFVVGENVEQSIDSRSFGFIPIDKVYGKVIVLPGNVSG